MSADRGVIVLHQIIVRKETSGSITVYLSLILLLILSLLLTITEGVRVGTARIYAERSLSTAMDSVLAEYYGPLWEEYHMFGLYTETENVEEQKKLVAEKLSNYMSYTFHPDKDLNISGGSNVELYDIMPDSVSVDNETLLMDYQGKLLINEAVEYMKYKEIGNGIEVLLTKLSLLQEPEKVSYIYEEKHKAEEELVEIDIGILELMELLDGLCTSENGIEFSKDGTLKTAEYFVKKICIGEATKERVGINHEKVYLALRSSYRNPIPDFEAMTADFTGISQTLRQIEVINAAIAQTGAELSREQTKLNNLNAIKKKTAEDKKQIKALKEAVRSLTEEINALSGDKNMQEQSISQHISNIEASKENLSALISGIKPVIRNAISVVDKIILKVEKAAPLIERYETFLYGSKDQIGEETFRGLNENLEGMKKYISVNDSGYDFEGMKVILMKNLNTLTQVENDMKDGEAKLSKKQYEEAANSFLNAAEELQSYQIEGLILDYSTLLLDNSAQKNPLSAVNNLLQKGLTSLLINPEQISKGKLTSDTHPSEIAALSEENTDYMAQLKDFFRNSIVSGGGLGMSSLFSSFGNVNKISDMVKDGINSLTELLLYQEYLQEHYESYSVAADSSSRKPSVLTYEQEYLLSGELTDQENLASVISRIIFLRMILDFVSIIGNSTKRNEARTAAAAIVGFTGLPILIAITQVIILLAWSFAEALLDVNALMQDKEIPVLKKTISLKLPELFLINRSFLTEKASKITASKELSMAYKDYLRMFLLLKSKEELTYRSTDLMQENIRLRYAVDSFHITSCLFGYEAKMEYTIPSKFTGLPFIQDFLGTDNKGFHFTVSTAYSY